MILDELRHCRVRRLLNRTRNKSNLFRERAVLPEKLDRIRVAGSRVGAIVKVHAYMQLMPPQPMLLRKLVRRHQLKFFAASRPLIEIIPAIAFRVDEHVGKSLAMRIAVKSRVLRNGAEDRAGLKLIAIR